jgi:hypothetical protein
MFDSLGKSGERHVARDVEALLAAEWTPDFDRDEEEPEGSLGRPERTLSL